MKVIAIHPAPTITEPKPYWSIHYKLERAYNQGDIFETKNPKITNFQDYPVIFNHHINDYMEVNPDNFQSLDSYRKQQLDKLL